MYNVDILQSLISKYGEEKAIEVCDIISTLYDIKFTACKTRECSEEYDYEREWWLKASSDLKERETNSN